MENNHRKDMIHVVDKEYSLYKDIQMRTGGEIYIGVVGPVRTGKSTFIKRFMDLLVLPNLPDDSEKVRLQDELPQSSGGRTITTTEPKFIPKTAAHIKLSGDIEVKTRLIDCVGFMVEGATGHMEENEERMVKTPWFSEEVPFTRAAEIGTKKVITDHSTIGIVVTTDGSIGELDRESYLKAEEQTIQELKRLQKPFLVIVNTQKPYSDQARAAAEEIREKYQVTSLPVNCMQMKEEDLHRCLKMVLQEFPVTCMEFYLPEWVEMMSNAHPLKEDLILKVRSYMERVNKVKDITECGFAIESPYVSRCRTDQISMADGSVSFDIEIKDEFYFDMLSEITDMDISGQYCLLKLLKDYKRQKAEYEKVQAAIARVRTSGYGVVAPDREEVLLTEPTIVKHGSKYGVKIKAESPSIHMIKANVITEIAPIVGSEQQAMDLIHFIKEEEKKQEGIWDTNIFGKTVEQLIFDGIRSKIDVIGDESQQNLQETMQKILNESNGGMIFIFI